jgi:hypothetical protein
MTDLIIGDYAELDAFERARFESACASWGMAPSDFDVQLVRRALAPTDDGTSCFVSVVRQSNGARSRYPASLQTDWPATFHRELEDGRFG